MKTAYRGGIPGMHFGEIANRLVSRTPAPGDGQWAQETT